MAFTTIASTLFARYLFATALLQKPKQSRALRHAA
jgi:hypothetical protein